MQQPNFFAGHLRYKTGDATIPFSAGHRIIIQVCNDVGAYGAGFSGAVAKRWPKVEEEYRRWCRSQHKFVLGEIQVINVQSDTTIVNMIAQQGIKKAKTKKDLMDYAALEKCLNQIIPIAKDNGSSVHGPRIGAGLCGSDWKKIEPVINDTLIKSGINVTIYDLPNE